MRSILKAIAASIAIVALVLSGYVMINRGFAIDPNSEIFTVNGGAYSPTWTPCAANGNSSGVDSQPSAFEHNYKGSGKVVEQRLFSYHYKNGFGQPAFKVEYNLHSVFNPDWSEHAFMLNVSGGGGTDGNAMIETTLDVPNQTLAVLIRQGFTAHHLTRETTLDFKWDGTTFQLQP